MVKVEFMQNYIAIIISGLALALASTRIFGAAVDRWEISEGHAIFSSDRLIATQSSKFRAKITTSRGNQVGVRVQFNGFIRDARPLGSGEDRAQFGVYLGASNQCNLVYIMWRLRPVNEIVVQVKFNPDADTTEECGNRGYRTIAQTDDPEPHLIMPPIANGARHMISASYSGETLNVLIDEQAIWAGNIPGEFLNTEGFSGVRSDNVNVQFNILEDGTI